MENGLTLYNVTANESGAPYTSLLAESEDTALLLYKAMNNPDESLSDYINEIVTIRHIFIQPIELSDQETGGVQVCPRIVLISDDGTTYVTISKGVYNSLKNLCAIIGTPETWKAPVKVKVIQRTIKERKMLSLDAVDFGGNLNHD